MVSDIVVTNFFCRYEVLWELRNDQGWTLEP
jgi:hypothetical protein